MIDNMMVGFDPHAWPEYFHMPVLMLMLITLLNDGTLIAIGYDNVIPTRVSHKKIIHFDMVYLLCENDVYIYIYMYT